MIGWKVAKDWIDFALRVMEEGQTPVKFSEQVESAVYQELCELCERKGDIELVYGISKRVRAEIEKLATKSCKVQISILNK